MLPRSRSALPSLMQRLYFLFALLRPSVRMERASSYFRVAEYRIPSSSTFGLFYVGGLCALLDESSGFRLSAGCRTPTCGLVPLSEKFLPETHVYPPRFPTSHNTSTVTSII